MKYNSHYVVTSIVIVLLHFAFGRLAHTLATPPDFAVPVWPAAGLAISVIMLGGYRYIPAIFLGGILANLVISIDLNGNLVAGRDILLALMAAAGATLQAAASAYLFRRFSGASFPPQSIVDVGLFILFAGVFGCVLNATLNPFALYLMGAMPLDALPSSMFTWWIGDVAGVILFFPILQLWSHQVLTQVKRVLIALPVIIFIALIILVFLNTHFGQIEKNQQEFDTTANSITNALDRDISVALGALTGIDSFINASEYVSHEEFTIFSQEFLRRHPAIHSLLWNPKVTHAQRARFEQEIRDQGFPKFVIRDDLGTTETTAATQREYYFPATYIVPYENNQIVHGYDAYRLDIIKDNIRRYTLDQARDNDMSVVTRRVSIVQSSHQYGVLVYHPVYNNNLLNESIVSRRQHLQGYAAAVVMLPKLFAPIAELARKSAMDVVVRDLALLSDTQLLYDSRTRNHKESIKRLTIPSNALQKRVNLDVAGHQWQLLFIQKTAGIEARSEWDFLMLLAGCLLFSLAMSAVIFYYFAQVGNVAGEPVVLQRQSTTYNQLELMARIGASLSVILGVIVLLGWYTHNTTLIQVHPSFVPMQFNTALGFLLSGLGLLAMFRKMKVTTLLLGLVVALIGLLTIVQYVFGLSLGIDQLLMEHYVNIKVSHPGRMAPNTAMCFLLMGIALLGTYIQRNSLYYSLLLRVLASLILVLGISALIGYFSHLKTAYAWLNLTHMAVHTALGFIILGISLFVYSWMNKYKHYGASSAFWLSSLVASVILLLSLALWQQINNQQQQNIQQGVSHQLNIIEANLVTHFNNSSSAIKRMAQRWNNAGGTPKEQWMLDTKHYLGSLTALIQMEWVDAQYHVRWRQSLPNYYQSSGIGQILDGKSLALLQNIPSDTIILSAPMRTRSGYRAVKIYVPVYANTQLDGFIVGIFDVDVLMNSVLTEKQNKQIELHISDADGAIFTTDDYYTTSYEYPSQAVLKLLGRKWSISAIPNSIYLQREKSSFSIIVLLIGAFIATLIGIVTYTVILARQRNYLLTLKGRALKINENRLSTIIEEAPHGILAMDCNGIIQSANKAIDSIFGYTENELLGSHIQAVIPGHSYTQYANDVLEGAHNNTIEKPIRNLEVYGLNKNGHQVNLEVGLNHCTLEDGSSQVIAMLQNVTQRYELDQERESMIEELTSSNEELGRFAFVCSHDLQEPLRMIRSFSERLQHHMGDSLIDDERGNKYFKFITEGAERAQLLIKDILAYSRLDSDTQKLEIFSAEDLIKVVKQDIDAQLTDCGAELTHDVLPDLNGNKTQIYQLMLNLINNAIKYRRTDVDLLVHIGVEDKETHWQFAVSDNGIGIEERHYQKIFEVFQRLHHRHEYAGSGVGLSICKNIVQRHGGKIWLTSTKGLGSIFYFTLLKPDNQGDTNGKSN